MIALCDAMNRTDAQSIPRKSMHKRFANPESTKQLLLVYRRIVTVAIPAFHAMLRRKMFTEVKRSFLCP